jgi:hypothetical protein
MPALDEQEPPLIILDDGAHTRDYGTGHAVKYQCSHTALASLV